MKNLNTFQNFISEIDFKKYNFIKKLDIKSSKNISNKKSKAVAKAKSLDKVEIFFKKLFKINSFKKYKISPEIFKNNFKSKLSKIDFKNIDLFLDKYLSEKIANQIKNFYKDNFKNTNRKEINSVDFLGIYYANNQVTITYLQRKNNSNIIKDFVQINAPTDLIGEFKVEKPPEVTRIINDIISIFVENKITYNE